MNSKKALLLFFLFLILLAAFVPSVTAQKPSDESERVQSVTTGEEMVPVPVPNVPVTPAPSKPVEPTKMAAAPALATVNDVQAEKLSDSLRIQISTSRAVRASVLKIKNPERILVDLTPAKLSGDVSGSHVGEMGIGRIRVGQYKPDTARVVLDVTAPVKHRLAVNGGQVFLWVDPVQPPVKPVKKDPPAPVVKIEEPRTETTDPPKPSVAIPSGPVQITKISTEPTTNGTRVRISLDRLTRANVLMLQDPLRLAVDIPGAVLVDGETSTDVTSALLNRIRTGQTTSPSKAARVVMDLLGRVSYNISYGINEILLDLQALRTRAPRKIAGARIVIDPGHGGKAPGASANGLKEKNINLAVGKKVHAILTEMGALASLTRNSDYDVSLDERVAIAERQGADLFVSIHCNSCGVPNSKRGTELYYYTDQSRDLAVSLQKRLVAALGTRNGGVFKRRFVVVRKGSMPSALVELGYINHCDEATNLCDMNWQQKAARAIVEGIAAYLGDTTVVPQEPATEVDIRIEESPADGGIPDNAISPEPEEESNTNETSE